MKFIPLLSLSLSVGIAHSTDVPLRINAGGKAIGDWRAGKEFVKGGSDFKFGGGHDLSKARNPGPAEIYETVRHRNHRYEIPGLPAGKYIVRFHFTDGFDVNSRAMDYKINGQLVINNLNIVKVAGGAKRVHVVDSPVTLNKSEVLRIEGHQDRGSDVFEAGLEILPLGNAPKVTMVSRKEESQRVVAAPVVQGNSKSELEKFMGGPARFVWVRSSKWGHYTKNTNRVELVGLDTRDGKGERKILPEAAAYGKPLFTADGRSIVYTDVKSREIFVVDFDGENRRSLGKGYASDVWRDPKTKMDWIYLRDGSGTKTKILRRRLDNGKDEEKIFWKSENGHAAIPWFQLSGDGRYFSDAFPWPHCGVGETSNQDRKTYERGCWPSISPDNSYRSFVFSGSHSEINLFEKGGKNRRKISVTTMPGMRGKKVYFPRWSNDPRFLTVTGPEKDNKADLWIGKFDSGFKKIEKWARVSSNSQADLFGDVWLGAAPISQPRKTTRIPLTSVSTPKIVVGDEEPGELEWPGSTKDLVWLWENALSQNEAPGIVCRGDLHGRARFGRSNELLLDHGLFRAGDAAAPRIVDWLKSANEFTLEAIVSTFDEDQMGPARIISFSKSSSERNFTLGQDGEWLVLRIRSSASDSNGTKREVRVCKLKPNLKRHILITYQGGVLHCYRNGELQQTHDRFPLDFSSWDSSMPLIFGDESNGGRDWKGTVEGVALFGRAFSEIQAAAQFRSANRRVAAIDLQPAETYAVSARLIESTKTPTKGELGSYRRALVENVYQIEKQIRGPALEDKIIVVRQWALMDGKPLPHAEKRAKGVVTELTLQTIEAHPQLEGEFRSGDHAQFDAPVLYDVNSHLR